MRCVGALTLHGGQVQAAVDVISNLGQETDRRAQLPVSVIRVGWAGGKVAGWGFQVAPLIFKNLFFIPILIEPKLNKKKKDPKRGGFYF